MYKTLAVIMFAAIFSFVTVAPAASQTEPVVKILVQNTNVLVQSVTFPPGARSAMTKRLAASVLFYTISGPAHVKFTYADGHSITKTLATGTANYQRPDTSIYRTNVGSNTFTLLVVVNRK